MILEYHLFASIPPGGVLLSAAATPIPALAAACCGMATSRYFDEEADEAEAALPAAAGGGASAADDEFDDYFGDDVDLSDFDEGAAEAETAKGGAAAAGGGASAAAPSAAAGGGASAAAPSSSSSAPPRVPRNDVLFKADARAAFAAMNLHAEYKLPPAPVLARDPDAPSAGRDTCPRALWKLIVSHGGYIEEGRNGVSRSRIMNQFRLWRKDTFGGGVGGVHLAPALDGTSLAAVLEQLVPDVGVLMVETADMRFKLSTVTRIRPTTRHVEVWTRDDCSPFWSAQRNNIVAVMVEAARDHATDKMYVGRMTHTHAPYAALFTILRQRREWPFTHGASCDFCMVRTGRDACDCLWVVAVEAVDMFTRVVLDHVDYDSNARRLTSPPADAIVPIASADAVYNISGALLYKVKERTTGTFRGIDEDARNSCLAFYAAHSVGEDVARRLALPVDKVVRQQFGHDSLTYVSASLFDFFSRLELVYWFNLNLQCAGGLRAETMQEIDVFARQDACVLAAWQQCMERLAEKTNTAVSECTARSEVMFSMLAKTYRNVRGKEYATVYAEMHSRDGARSTSTTRDQLAAGNYVNAQNRKNRGDT
jgi:hypothetical protein